MKSFIKRLCVLVCILTCCFAFAGCVAPVADQDQSSDPPTIIDDTIEEEPLEPSEPLEPVDPCADGHSFVLNVCSECGYTQSDLSELTQTQRNEYSIKIYAMITAYSDNDILDTYISLIRLQSDMYNDAVDLVEELEQIVEEEKESLEEIKNNRHIMSFNPATNQFEYVADAKAVKAQEAVVEQAERDLQSAQRRQEQAISDLSEYITYFNITCYNECLNITVDMLDDGAISNSMLKQRILIVSLKFDSAFTHLDTISANDFNSWQDEFIETIKETTGIDYDSTMITDIS